jgi:5-methylcytosine-specific restriction protein A
MEIDATSPEATEMAELPESVIKPSLKLWSRPLKEVRELAIQSPKMNATTQERRIITHQRSEAVRVYILRRAKGVCECCDAEAPFKTKKGRPYLEPHHIRRISDGGPDDPRWVAAVCPNCHKEVHYGINGNELNQKLADKLGDIESRV